MCFCICSSQLAINHLESITGLGEIFMDVVMYRRSENAQMFSTDCFICLLLIYSFIIAVEINHKQICP